MKNENTYKFSGKLTMPDNLEMEYIVGDVNLTEVIKAIYTKSLTQEAEIVFVGQMGEFFNGNGFVHLANGLCGLTYHIDGLNIEGRLFYHTGEFVEIKITTDVDLEELVYGKVHIS